MEAIIFIQMSELDELIFNNELINNKIKSEFIISYLIAVFSILYYLSRKSIF